MWLGSTVLSSHFYCGFLFFQGEVGGTKIVFSSRCGNEKIVLSAFWTSK